MRESRKTQQADYYARRRKTIVSFENHRRFRKPVSVSQKTVSYLIKTYK